MTTKTKRTLASIEALSGIPTVYSAPVIVVPQSAWSEYVARLEYESPRRHEPGFLIRTSLEAKKRR